MENRCRHLAYNISDKNVNRLSNVYIRDCCILIDCPWKVIEHLHRRRHYNMPMSRDHYAELGEGVHQLWTRGQLCDVTLCCEDRKFHAHSVVLAAYSKTLLTMILEKQNDSKVTHLNITVVPPAVLKLLLQYFYTGVTPHLDESVLQAVKDLDIPSLSDNELTEDNSQPMLMEPFAKSDPQTYDDTDDEQNEDQSVEATMEDESCQFPASTVSPEESIPNSKNIILVENGVNIDPFLTNPMETDFPHHRHKTNTRGHDLNQVGQLTEPYSANTSGTLQVISCDQCDRTFPSKKQLYSHVLSAPDHLDGYVIKKGCGRNRSHQPGMYQCLLCLTEFTLKREFIQHFPKFHKDLEKCELQGSPCEGTKEIPQVLVKETLDPKASTSEESWNHTDNSLIKSTSKLKEITSGATGLYKLPTKAVRSNQKLGGSTYKHVEQFIACKMANLQRNVSNMPLYQCAVCKADFVFKKLACKHIQKCHKEILRQHHDTADRASVDRDSGDEDSRQGSHSYGKSLPESMTLASSETGTVKGSMSESESINRENISAPDSGLVDDTAKRDTVSGLDPLPHNSSMTASVTETTSKRTSSDSSTLENKTINTTDTGGNCDEPALYPVQPKNQPRKFAADHVSSNLQLNKYILCKMRNMQRNSSKLPAYMCQICEAQFRLRNTVYKHIREAHPEVYMTAVGGTAATRATVGTAATWSTVGTAAPRPTVRKRGERSRNANFKHLEPYINKKGNMMRNVSEEPGYECSVCKQSFVYKKDILRHFVKFHRKIHRSMPNSLKFLCTVCGKLYSSSGALSNHMEVHTSDPVHCYVCDKVFKTKLLLHAHLTNMHQLGSAASSYQCERCGESFINYYGLRYHSQTKHEPKKRCADCGKEFVSKFGLNQHVREKHNEVKTARWAETSCPQCGKVFFRKNLRAHIRAIHMKDDPTVYKFVCEFCGMRFYKSDKYRRHKKTHEKKLQHPSNTTGRSLQI